MIRRLVPLGLVVLAVALPYSVLQIPILFDSPLQSPGVLQLMVVCFVFAALAQSYDLLFGRTGLMSFGHALYFACGVYGTTIIVNRMHWSWLAASVAAAVLAVTLALLLGSIVLHAHGLAFAMVTLALAQVGTIVVVRNPGGVTGGTDGLSMDVSGLPKWLIGVSNTVNIYWIALAYLVAVTAGLWWLTRSAPGRLLAAIRDNPLRAGVLGVNVYRAKLGVFALSAVIAAGAGSVYALAFGGATPNVATSDLTLMVLVMVVLGGPGTRWGPLVGAFAYEYLDHRLHHLGTSAADASLPGWLQAVLAQPMLPLGFIFLLLVVAAPDGIRFGPRQLGTGLRR